MTWKRALALLILANEIRGLAMVGGFLWNLDSLPFPLPPLFF